MRVHRIRIENFKVLKDVEMNDIPGFAVLVGANGSGKSTFIDVFEFLKDCLKNDVRSALQRRGGFAHVVSRGQEAKNIVIELQVEMEIEAIRKSRLVTYRIEIEEKDRNVSVASETLRFKRQEYGAPFHFIRFAHGQGEAIPEVFDTFDKGVALEEIEREPHTLKYPYLLAIKGLGQFRQFDAARQLSGLIENWTVSDFHIEDARLEPDAAVAEHLNETGGNLANYAEYLRRDHPEAYQAVIEKMARYVPGVAEVITEDFDGRVVLRFRDKAFEKGFIARAVSDGTIKMFAYLALLHDPHPHPLLCIEEPENQLYPTLLGTLAEEFAAYAVRRQGDGQVFATTHSPDFLNSVPLEAIYWLEKRDGFSAIRRAADDLQLKALVDAGDRPGWLWREGLFGGADP